MTKPVFLALHWWRHPDMQRGERSLTILPFSSGAEVADPTLAGTRDDGIVIFWKGVVIMNVPSNGQTVCGIVVPTSCEL